MLLTSSLPDLLSQGFSDTNTGSVLHVASDKEILSLLQ